MDKKVLLSVKNLEVKFNVRGRVLTAIRNISLDIYENESIAIVGESGSGKSVFTKTFAGMLDNNGFISNGDLIFDDEELSYTNCNLSRVARSELKFIKKKLDKYCSYVYASDKYKELIQLVSDDKKKRVLSDEELESFETKKNDLLYERTELFNHRQTLDPRNEREQIKEEGLKIKAYDAEIQQVENEKQALIRAHKEKYRQDTAYIQSFKEKKKQLKSEIKEIIKKEPTEKMLEINDVLAKEVYLSTGRYGYFQRLKNIFKLLKELKLAFKLNVDLENDDLKNSIFDNVVFRVKLIDENENMLYGKSAVNLAKIKYTKDWQQIRGRRISTIFQDPMTSLNPIIPIGKQISAIIMKHQHVSEVEARRRAVELMFKVGIPNPDNRYNDYPFQYSGGMRQRIVIAIALSCQPKILICDEPTTALDVTIQAQILKLIKDLQKEFNYTIVFITHDLGVVANIADRVAVLYAGQMVEIGTAEEVFYDPRHPYTWALLSSMPQLAQRNTTLYTISGTPPSLYNKIVGDPFAPRNPYCLTIDTLKDSPMFKVTDTHYAKTWLLDPRAPKTEKPEAIQNIHEKLIKAFNI